MQGRGRNYSVEKKIRPVNFEGTKTAEVNKKRTPWF
jgi:hypothetical protein